MSHARNAPSAAHRWMNCPGSVALCADVESVDSVYSKEGTFAHAVAAACLTNGEDAAKRIGFTDGEFTVDTEMAEHIQVYLDAVRGVLAMDEGTLRIEEKVVISDDVSGTSDAVIATDDTLHVFDLKFGKGVFVEAEENEQLMIYSLGALKALKALGKSPKHVVMHIVQPRCSADRLHREWSCSAAFLNQWSVKMLAAVDATYEPNAPLCPGDWCGFCPKKASCPALREKALTTASSVFSNLDSPPQRPISPANLSPEQLAVVLDGQDLLEKWLKGVNQMAFDMLNRGESIPGYKLVEKTGNRRWRDEAAAQAALASTGVDPFAPREIVSPAQAEKLLTKTRLGKSGAEKWVEQHAHKPVTGSIIVPVADPRPALSRGAASFQPLE